MQFRITQQESVC